MARLRNLVVVDREDRYDDENYLVACRDLDREILARVSLEEVREGVSWTAVSTVRGFNKPRPIMASFRAARSARGVAPVISKRSSIWRSERGWFACSRE